MDEESASAAKVGDSEAPPKSDRQQAVSTRMHVVHRELEELDRFREERLKAEEVDDDNEKSLTNKDALLIETNPLERAEVLANEEAGKRDRMRREDSKNVLQQYIGMQVMAEIKRRKRLRAASKTLDDLELLAHRVGDGRYKGDSDAEDVDDAADSDGSEVEATAATAVTLDAAANEAEVATTVTPADASEAEVATAVTHDAGASESDVATAVTHDAGASEAEAAKAVTPDEAASEAEATAPDAIINLLATAGESTAAATNANASVIAEASAVAPEYKSESEASGSTHTLSTRSTGTGEASNDSKQESADVGGHRYDYV